MGGSWGAAWWRLSPDGLSWGASGWLPRLVCAGAPAHVTLAAAVGHIRQQLSGLPEYAGDQGGPGKALPVTDGGTGLPRWWGARGFGRGVLAVG